MVTTMTQITIIAMNPDRMSTNNKIKETKKKGKEKNKKIIEKKTGINNINISSNEEE